MADIVSLEERARALKGGQVGKLRVSTAPQVIENLVAPFLEGYLRRHPGIEVELLETGLDRRSQLERGEIHLAIMAAGDDQRLHRRLLYPIYVLAALPQKHRLARRAVIDIVELADEPLLLLKRGFGSRAWFDAACSVADIHPPVLLESGAPATLMALAEVGCGVAIIPSNVHALRKTIRGVQLVHRAVPIGRWSSIAWNPQRFVPPYAKHFIDELVGYVRTTYPGRDLTRRARPLPRPED